MAVGSSAHFSAAPHYNSASLTSLWRSWRLAWLIVGQKAGNLLVLGRDYLPLRYLPNPSTIRSYTIGNALH